VNAFNALQTPMTPMNEVNNLPAVPSDPRDPGSQSYPYQMKVETFSLNNQAAELFLPQMTSPEPLTLIVYGHGQAINSSGYRETFNHLARKGVAVLHPNYDRGFFDQEWRRMAQDYVKLTEEAIRRFPQFLSNERVIYSGHSKGAYVALIAAGIPSSPISPRATILFAPAGFDREWLRNLNPNMPLSLFWSEADTTIQESLVTEIYSLAPSPRKQYFRVKSYANGNIPADHFFPLSKKFFFGGRDGISPYHYWGTWRWLMGAVWEADTSSSTDGSYLYGNEALEMGAPGQSHDVRRSW
jgi:predicted esterase